MQYSTFQDNWIDLKSTMKSNELKDNFPNGASEPKSWEESVILWKSERENDKEAIGLHQVQYSIEEQ